MALVAIALVLSAVFLPMVFFGGSTGVIYRQFSATIVSAMALSVFIALTLSPAIAANILRRNHATVEETWLGRSAPRGRPLDRTARVKFNDGFDRFRDWFVAIGHTAWSTANGCSSASTPASFALLILLFFRLADRLPPDRGPGRALGPVPTAGRRDDDPHAAGAARRSRIISCTGPKRRTSRPISRSPAAARARPARIPARRISTSPITIKRKGAKNSADAIVQRASGAFRGLARCAGLRAGPGRDPRPWPVDRLHHGVAEHRRHEPAKQFAGRARPAARRSVRRSRS